MLSQPPRNNVGQVIQHDHREILDSDGIIRRISSHLIVVDASGNHKISTMAFNPSSPENGGGLSVDLQREIEEAGHVATNFVTTPKWFGSVKFSAGVLRKMEFLVGFNPMPPENPYHGEVWGQFSKRRKKQLLQNAVWFVRIPNVSLF